MTKKQLFKKLKKDQKKFLDKMDLATSKIDLEKFRKKAFSATNKARNIQLSIKINN